MKNKETLLLTKWIVFIMVLTFTGCVGVSSPTPEPTHELPTATLTIKPTAAPTIEPTVTATVEPTATTTPTAAPTIEPTATETVFVIPTPPGANKDEQLIWLLETNNGCKLPCWWGITPGETKWEEVEGILALFDSNIYTASSSGIDYYNPIIALPFGPYEVNEVRPVYVVQNGIIIKITTLLYAYADDAPIEYKKRYELAIFLEAYGQPEEIWLSTYRSAFEGNDLPFFVVLYYPSQGILVSYSDNGVAEGNFVQGCPQKESASVLYLFKPGALVSFTEVTKSSLFNRDYLPLEEATEIDVATFYNTFKDPTNTECLATFRDLWR